MHTYTGAKRFVLVATSKHSVHAAEAFRKHVNGVKTPLTRSLRLDWTQQLIFHSRKPVRTILPLNSAHQFAGPVP
jgi:hypothetical protein